jgi:hypothetical protein
MAAVGAGVDGAGMDGAGDGVPTAIGGQDRVAGDGLDAGETAVALQLATSRTVIRVASRFMPLRRQSGDLVTCR